MAMLGSSPSKVNMQPQLPSVTGMKRPAPSLLPAFDEDAFSSSPGYPRPSKRRATSPAVMKPSSARYPTPIATSSTGMCSSSPPKAAIARPTLRRTQSIMSERAPLSAVRTLELSADGDVLRLGRSSSSSDHVLSTNRLISRVHVTARYIASASSISAGKVEIVCEGWNGVKIHCNGRTWELHKLDTFTSETASAEIMLDVHDARVIIGWPKVVFKRDSSAERTESSGSESESPNRRFKAVSARGKELPSSPTAPAGGDTCFDLPESPTPTSSHRRNSLMEKLSSARQEEPLVKIYEDISPPDDEADAEGEPDDSQQLTQQQSQRLSTTSSTLSDPEDSEDAVDENDPDEENDPIIFSFGPGGDDLNARLDSFTTSATPAQLIARLQRDLSAVQEESNSDTTPTADVDELAVANHVINQLAFSRLSSTPLSVVVSHLPPTLLAPSSSDETPICTKNLYRILTATKCIGEIHREGKDAAGKPLESEFYYIPDMDVDEGRKAAVVEGMQKPSLRNCRKQHKQYYWKKPSVR